MQSYTIDGMTCGGCVASVKRALEALPNVEAAHVQLEAPQARLQLKQATDLQILQAAIGHYTISPEQVKELNTEASVLPEKSWSTYQPLLLIVSFIAGVSLLVQYPFDNFSAMLWMRHFMAGFFIVFAFFKLLNVEGFANSYQMYDIIAARWRTWAYIYPFVELGLGVLYLINIAPTFTNWATILVLGVSSIGVIKSNLDRRAIKCACLGDVFNLPMSTVTIVEDLTMVAMAVAMLFL